MALHGEEGLFDTAGFFPGHGLGNAGNRQRYIAFRQAPSISGGVVT
jgi:hypothetical protein